MTSEPTKEDLDQVPVFLEALRAVAPSVSPVDEAAAEIAALKAKLKEAEEKLALLDTFVAEKVKTLREALKSSYISLFMDGRNEHGTHLLEAGGGTSILCIDEVMKALHPKDNTAEDIFKEAEAAGHAAGHSIVTRWRYIDGECQYWEFEAIDHLLTSVMHGTAAEQQANFDALTPSSPGGEP